MIAKPTTKFEEEWLFFEILVFAPLWEVLFKEFAGHLETNVTFFEFLEVVSGVKEEVPDEEVFKIVVVLTEGALFFETIINTFKCREDIEIFAGPDVFVKDGIGVFEIEVKWLVDGGEVVGIEDEGRHQLHIFVNNTIFEGKTVLDPPVAADEELPWAGAVADEAVFVMLLLRVDGREILSVAILEDTFGAEHGKVGFSLFGGAIEFFDSGGIDIIISIDEPHIDAVGHGDTKVACGSGAPSIALIIANNLWVVGEIFHDDLD